MVDETAMTTESPQDEAAPNAAAAQSPHMTLAAECQAIAERLAELGVSVNYGGRINLGELKPTIESSAAGEILVAKGICTEEEWHFTTMRLLHSLLATVLQQQEEKALKAAEQAARPQIVVPRGGTSRPEPVRLVRRGR